jgi:hypothetical protein
MKDEVLDVFVTIFFASGFLVPGFVLHRTIGLFIVQRKEDIQIFVLRFLAYTLFMYLLAFPHYYWIYSAKYYLRHPFLTSYLAIFLMFGLPVLFGIGIGVLLQWYKRSRHVIEDVLDKLKIYLLDHEHTAWGYQFCRLMEGIDAFGTVVVTVTLKDGSQQVGAYGRKSFASEPSEHADIYIERLYESNGDGNYLPVPNSQGILIKHAEILSIRFDSIYAQPKEEDRHDGQREPETTRSTAGERSRPGTTGNGQSQVGADS